MESARLTFPCCSGGNEKNRAVSDLFYFKPRGINGFVYSLLKLN